jgi:hypothetical protein
MTDAASEFEKLKAVHGDIVHLKEGGVSLALLRQFNFRASGKSQMMDLLLYPGQHGGYVTRLFFEREIPGAGKNWQRYRVADGDWWAPSFNNVPASLPWIALLCAHLRAVE